MSEKKFDYTKAVAELDEIAAKVEDPATSLDDIGALVKRSKELIESCRKYLRTVRDSIEDSKEQPPVTDPAEVTDAFKEIFPAVENR